MHLRLETSDAILRLYQLLDMAMGLFWMYNAVSVVVFAVGYTR